MFQRERGLYASLASLFGDREKAEDWEPSDEEARELVLRAEAHTYRSAIRRSAYGGGVGSPQRLRADRFARDVSRRRLNTAMKAANLSRPRGVAKSILLAKCKGSPILDRLLPDRHEIWLPILKRRSRKRPAFANAVNFSFLTHPAETLDLFKQIAKIETREVGAYLHFRDHYCLDAGAYLVLAEVWDAVKDNLLGGHMELPVQKVLDAIGVGEHNKMKLKGVNPSDSKDPEHTDVWAFPLERRRPSRSSKSRTVHLDPQSREKTADQFCNAVNSWIGVKEIDQELTDAGKGWISQIIGELLCNAERHSQRGSSDGDWSTTGFMTRRVEDGKPVYSCSIAFLSVGRSIAESLEDAAPHMRGHVRKYVTRHSGCGLSDDTLATVFALQDTVTCDPEASSSFSGGTGLQDVLEFVNDLGGTAALGREPRVTVVSGASCIMLRPPFVRGVRAPDDPHARRLIWFNLENRPDRPPDSDYVRDLPEHFAGTLVSVAFTLDPAYLASQLESDDEDD